jgi:hypothetical protein
MTLRLAIFGTILLGLLSGCGTLSGLGDRLGGGPAIPLPSGVPPADVAFCQHQAEDAPKVKEMEMIGLGNVNYAASNQLELRQAKQDALMGCLRGRGVIPPGGVERPKTS